MSNSVDPDETAHNEPSYLDLCCLQKLIIIASGNEGVKAPVVFLLAVPGGSSVAVILCECVISYVAFVVSLLTGARIAPVF